MTKNQWKIIDKQFISYYGGHAHLISNGVCKFWVWHDEKASQKICDKLNELEEENSELLKYSRSLLEYHNAPRKHRKRILKPKEGFKK